MEKRILQAAVMGCHDCPAYHYEDDTGWGNPAHCCNMAGRSPGLVKLPPAGLHGEMESGDGFAEGCPLSPVPPEEGCPRPS